MIAFLQAVFYFVCHPFDRFSVTVVRRYADAQGNYIGELYEGDGRGARMIGWSCDNWPLNADTDALPLHPKVCWRKSFLEPLPVNTLRVGSMEPDTNADVQAYVAKRRFLLLNVNVLNRFVEHILEPNKRMS